MFQDPELLKTINNVYFLSYIMFLSLYAVLWFFKLSIRKKIFPASEGFQAVFWLSFGICTVISAFQFLGNILSDGSAPPFAFWVNFVYTVILCSILIAVGLFLGLSLIRDKLPER